MGSIMTHTKCTDCGNNSSNHALAWTNNTLAIVMAPFDRILSGNYFGKMVNNLLGLTTRPYLWLLKTLHLISWNEDSTQAATKRSEVIWDEAKKRGIVMKQLRILKKPVEFYSALLTNGKQIFFESIPQTKDGYIESYSWMDDKIILKKKLQSVHIAVPKGGSAWNYKQALRIFNTIEKPIIIKPRIGSRGRHTTTFVSNLEEFKKAYTSAKKLCFWVVVEEHLYGSVYRATCINGTVRGVLEGAPPRITGNGTDTIGKLILQKNQNRVDQKIKEVVLDAKLDAFLQRIGKNRQTILESGKTIDIDEKIGLSYGGDSQEIFDKTDPKIIEELEKAAAIINAGVIGFDFITTDPTHYNEKTKWGIIECNSLPFINLHHDPRIGNPINIAGYVWDEVKSNY